MRFTIFLAMLLAGCSSTKTLYPQLDIHVKPGPGQEIVAELGDTMLLKSQRFVYDGIELLDRVERGYGLGVLAIEPSNMPALQEDGEWTYYYADTLTLNGGEFRGGLKVSRKDRRTIEIFTNNPLIKRRVTDPMPRMEFKKVTSIHDPSFDQELIYNGRSGDNIKFLYREYRNHLARDAFKQEVQYDLSQSKVIGFKGARIEIIEASNTRVKFKVLDDFPDDEEIRKRNEMRKAPDLAAKPIQRA